jgi:hypothetical protein
LTPEEKFSVVAESGQDGEPEPRAVVIDGERHEVTGITDRWHDEQATYFKLAASDGHMYLVRCELETNFWSLVREWMLDA